MILPVIVCAAWAIVFFIVGLWGFAHAMSYPATGTNGYGVLSAFSFIALLMAMVATVVSSYDYADMKSKKQ
jgi:hypothetical protein